MLHDESHIFVALYAGQTVGEAKIIAASADSELIEFAASRMLKERSARRGGNAVAEAIIQGQCSALKLISDLGRREK